MDRLCGCCEAEASPYRLASCKDSGASRFISINSLYMSTYKPWSSDAFCRELRNRALSSSPSYQSWKHKRELDERDIHWWSCTSVEMFEGCTHLSCMGGMYTTWAAWEGCTPDELCDGCTPEGDVWWMNTRGAVWWMYTRGAVLWMYTRGAVWWMYTRGAVREGCYGSRLYFYHIFTKWATVCLRDKTIDFEWKHKQEVNQEWGWVFSAFCI